MAQVITVTYDNFLACRTEGFDPAYNLDWLTIYATYQCLCEFDASPQEVADRLGISRPALRRLLLRYGFPLTTEFQKQLTRARTRGFTTHWDYMHAPTNPATRPLGIRSTG